MTFSLLSFEALASENTMQTNTPLDVLVEDLASLIDGAAHTTSLSTSSQASAVRKDARDIIQRAQKRAKAPQDPHTRDEVLLRMFRRRCTSAGQRARAKGVPFEMTPELLLELYYEQQGQYTLTGRLFSTEEGHSKPPVARRNCP